MKKHLTLLMLVITAVIICSCAVKKADVEIPVDKSSVQKSDSDGAESISENSEKKDEPEWDRIVKEKKIFVGISNQEFNRRLVEELKLEMGMEAEITRFDSFDDAAEALKNKDIDMYIGEFPKESKRSLEFALSDAYIQGTSVVIGKSEDYKADKNEDVAGVLTGSAEEKTVDLYFNNHLSFSSHYELFSALNSGKISCVFIDEYSYEKSGFKRDGLYVCDSYVYNLIAIFNEQCTDVASEMNVYLAKVKASGVAGEISEEIYGKDIIYK